MSRAPKDCNNVALLHYSAPPVVGGVEEVIRQQAFLFRRNLVNVKIIAGKGEQFEKFIPVEINPLISSSNIEVEEAMNELRKGRFEKFRLLKEKIRKYLISTLKDFDFLIVHNVLNMRYNLPLTYAVHEIADEDYLKVINWCHDSLYFYDNYDKIFDIEPFDILKKFNPKITYVTISESRRKLFSKLYNVNDNDIHIIKNGVDPITFFKLDINTVKILEEADLYNADIILFQPSRLHPRKNIEMTIKVVRALKDMGVKAKALVTGAFDPHEKKTVEYYEKLKNLSVELSVERDVILLAKYELSTGEIIESDRMKIRDLYHLSDVLFMPSIQEGFGIPLLEAGMLKMPIVCSDIPPFREIAGEVATFFGLNDDEKDIAEKVLNSVQNSNVSKFFRFTLKEYSWDNIFKNEVIPLLSSLC